MHIFRFEFAGNLNWEHSRPGGVQTSRGRASPKHQQRCVAAESSTNAAEMGEVSMRFAKSGPASPKSPVSAQQAEKPQENFGLSALTSCLVDADGNMTAGAGRARRKALGVSALIQFCTLVALLVVPLFATGSRLILRPTNFVPLPPYGGAPRHDPPRAQQQPPRTQNISVPTGFHDPAPTPIRPPTKIP